MLLERRHFVGLISLIVGLALVATTLVPAGADTPALAITITSLPNGVVGSSYSVNLQATGGTAPYKWSIPAGSQSLPTGLKLSDAGVISGIPTVSGTSQFFLQVTDSAVTSTWASLSITVNPSIVITPATLPTGEVSFAYPATTLTATGGTAPYTWSISDGALPVGLSLGSSNGQISGTPAATGTYTFTAQVRDNVARVATAALSITINDRLSIATVSLPNGSVGVAYSQTLAASGGVTPYYWSRDGGALPDGLALAPSGQISGSPTKAQIVNFRAIVTDDLGQSATRWFSINIATGLTVATTSLPDGTVGTAYLQTLNAIGGMAPYTWELSGSLPTGLSLNTSTGVISGTPTVAQTRAFSVTVTDSATSTDSQVLSISIAVTIAPDISTPEQPGLDHLADRVQAACTASAIAALDTADQEVQTALCDYFQNGPTLSPSMQNEVGHLILVIGGVMAPGNDNANPNSNAGGNGQGRGNPH